MSPSDLLSSSGILLTISIARLFLFVYISFVVAFIYTFVCFIGNDNLLSPMPLTHLNLQTHNSLLQSQLSSDSDMNVELYPLPSLNNDFPKTHDTNDNSVHDGYIEDLTSFDDVSDTTNSLFSGLSLNQPSTAHCSPTSHILNSTEIQLMELKSLCVLLSQTMNKIIAFNQSCDFSMLPNCYEDIEGKVFNSSIIHEKELEGSSIHFIPLQNWLPLLLQVNLLHSLVVSPASTLIVGDLSSGTWFSEFLARAPGDHIPLAIDIYYDHWKVSDSSKLGGLYMTVANTLPSFLLQPVNKFVLALVQDKIDLHVVLLLVLHDMIYHNGLFEVIINDTSYKFYIEIA